jgi:hypothetical protein
MNTQLRSVTSSGVAEKRRPRIHLYAPAIADMGFKPEALVQVLPEEDGMVFTLCNENIGKYSALLNDTREKGGKLIQVYLAKSPTHYGPAISTTGKYIRTAGLDMGDTFVVRYSYGLIRIRKLPDIANARFMLATAIRKKRTDEPIPKVRLYGEWLSDIGFTIDALATATAEPGAITFKLQDNNIESYSALVKYARRNKAKLIQARADGRGNYPTIEMTGAIVVKAGFTQEDVFVARYEYGTINLQKLDFKRLGF